MPNEQRKTAEQWLKQIESQQLRHHRIEDVQRAMDSSEAIGRAEGVVEGMREAVKNKPSSASEDCDEDCDREYGSGYNNALDDFSSAILSAADEKEKQL